MKKAQIFMHDKLAGILIENDEGYEFIYDDNYRLLPHAEPISLTIPLTSKVHRSNVLFPFFDGLIPEGFILDIAIKNWKLNIRDRMSILLVTCKDCIGAVSVQEIK